MILEINVLLRAINCLGIKKGIEYYKLYKNAKKNPELILNWIRKCNDTANKIKEENPELSNIFRDWAALLRKHYIKYKREINKNIELKLVSNCCRAEFKVVGITTKYHVCKMCGKPCDLAKG